MKIIWHIGLHKTGTTSFQRYCDKHRDHLAQQGVYWPTHVDGVRSAGKAELVNKLVEAGPSQMIMLRDILGTWRAEAEAADAHTIIVSAEDLDKPRWVSEMLAKGASDFDNSIYMVFRNRAEYCLSLLGERAKRGDILINNIERMRTSPRRLDVDKRIRQWETFFGEDKVHVGFYDKNTNDLVGAYLDWMGINGSEPQVLKHNKSLPNYLILHMVSLGLLQNLEDFQKFDSACKSLAPAKHHYCPSDSLISNLLLDINSDTVNHPKVAAFKDELLAPLVVDTSHEAAKERVDYVAHAMALYWDMIETEKSATRDEKKEKQALDHKPSFLAKLLKR